MMPCFFCNHAANAQCQIETCDLVGANDNAPPVAPADRIIYLPSDDVLKQPHVYHRTAMVYRAWGISRRNLAEVVNDLLWNFAGEVFDQHSIYIELLLIDAHDLLWPDSDPEARLISDFYAVADAMPKQTTQARVLPRLRLLWMALAVACPQLAQIVLR
jgi:hypothetical protein